MALWTSLLLILLLGLAACESVAPEPDDDPGAWILAPTDRFPARLSDLGLFTDLPAAAIADDVEAYDLRYPLFSDGNAKTRYLYLPPGVMIDTSDARAWVFPVGATLFKTFTLTARGATGGRRVETRVLHKRPSGWIAGTYLWNGAQTDGTLTDGDQVELEFELPEGAYTYTVPSEADCAACHGPTPDWVLGFEALRLDQVQLEHFEARLSVPVSPVEIPGPATERAAIGALHGNCANCHHPQSQVYAETQLDLRYWNLRDETVDVQPLRFLSTDPQVRLIKPQEPENSLIYLMMERTLPLENAAMPPIGTSLLDDENLDRVRAWIESLPLETQ